MADWRQYLPKGKAVTRGDVGAAGLGYAAGFAVDVFLFPLALSFGCAARNYCRCFCCWGSRLKECSSGALGGTLATQPRDAANAD